MKFQLSDSLKIKIFSTLIMTVMLIVMKTFDNYLNHAELLNPMIILL